METLIPMIFSIHSLIASAMALLKKKIFSKFKNEESK